MTKMFSMLALGAAVLAPFSVVHAQKVPGAQIAVVDSRRLLSECNACKAANAQLQTQQQSIQQRQQQLQQSLQAEGSSLQAAVGALQGKQPDPALQKRIEAFQQKQASANQELQGRGQTLQRNADYVRQQIGAKLQPIFQTVAGSHGANLVLDLGQTAWNSPALDVTNDVLAQLNQQLPSVSTTAPAAPAAQGR